MIWQQNIEYTEYGVQKYMFLLRWTTGYIPLEHKRNQERMNYIF